jgi:hypothetical protein
MRGLDGHATEDEFLAILDRAVGKGDLFLEVIAVMLFGQPYEPTLVIADCVYRALTGEDRDVPAECLDKPAEAAEVIGMWVRDEDGKNRFPAPSNLSNCVLGL